MRARHTVQEQFSSFLSIEGEGPQIQYRWITQSNLARAVRAREISDPEAFALTLLDKLRQSSCAQSNAHLIAYLQEICYWAARKVQRRLALQWSDLEERECFLMASEILAQPLKLLKTYDPSWGTKLKTYAQHRLELQLGQRLYTMRGWRQSTNWGLLRKVSNRQLKEAVERHLGVSGQELVAHQLAVNSFKEVYAPIPGQSSRQLAEPTQGQWQMMVQQYNQSAARLEMASVNVSQFRALISASVQSIRAFSTLPIVEPPDNFDVEDHRDSGIETLIAQEQEQQQQELSEILNQSFGQLPLDQQALLLFISGLRIRQQDISQVRQEQFPGFPQQQYQVARKLTKCRKQLYQAFLQRLNPNGGPLTEAQLKQIKPVLDEWLKHYFIKEFNNCLDSLYQRHMQNIDKNQKEDLVVNLFDELRRYIEAKFQVSLPRIQIVNDALQSIVEHWLENHLRGGEQL
uniref:Uncharacterized protein n=1 Tax=Cyanothece sp. (strain PCC 7425 / ATCC 29141) TaxID=395961 RepID=B8HYT0_CYAP4